MELAPIPAWKRFPVANNELRNIDLAKWFKGDCVICGSAFCVEKVPFKVRVKKNTGAYACCHCGHGYTKRGEVYYASKKGGG